MTAPPRAPSGFLGEAVQLTDEVERSCFDLVVDAADVLADDAHDDELDPADERRDEDDREPARDEECAGELRDERGDAEEEGASGDDEAEIECQPQRPGREAEEPVGREADHPRQRVLRAAGEPGGCRVFHGDLAEAEPCEHPAHEAVALRHRAKRLDDAAVREAEVARCRRNVDARELAQQAVVDAGRVPLEPALRPLGHHAVDDVVPLPPPSSELGEKLRRMLEVAVHDDDGITVREIDARGDRELMPEVSRELDHLEARVAAVQLEHERIAQVGAAVVDEQHLGFAVEQREDVFEPAVELLQRLLLVVDRHDDRIGGMGLHVNAL
jgi:hypothetical protein